jgi:RimJ/RimL family protein N-acetyltransferase
MIDEIEIGGLAVPIHVPSRADISALARFAAIVPPHDLLFLARDIREPRVLEAWIAAVEAGELDSLVALTGGEIVATAAIVADRLSWSRHVAELRLLVAPAFRNKGLGRRLLERAVQRACDAGATKLTARMTPDQTGAITLFEECGFRAEALLRDHVRDAEGQLHDLALLALDPAREQGRREAFGA